MNYEDIAAKSAYRKILEGVAPTDPSAPPPADPSAPPPPADSAIPDTPPGTEANPENPEAEVTEEKYSGNNDTSALKAFKKLIVDDILAGNKISEDIKNILLSTLLKTTGKDDDLGVAKDAILKSLDTDLNELVAVVGRIKDQSTLR